MDELFYQEWVRALFQHAVDDLRQASHAAGRDVDVRRVRALRSRRARRAADLRPLAAELGLTPATVTNHLAAMRRQFRRTVLDRLRDLTTSDEEFEAEARRLLGGTS